MLYKQTHCFRISDPVLYKLGCNQNLHMCLTAVITKLIVLFDFIAIYDMIILNG